MRSIRASSKLSLAKDHNLGFKGLGFKVGSKASPNPGPLQMEYCLGNSLLQASIRVMSYARLVLLIIRASRLKCTSHLFRATATGNQKGQRNLLGPNIPLKLKQVTPIHTPTRALMYNFQRNVRTVVKTLETPLTRC